MKSAPRETILSMASNLKTPGNEPSPQSNGPLVEIVTSIKDSNVTETLDLSNFRILPHELRAMIWESTFEPRQISLVCESFPQEMWDPPFKLISMLASEIPSARRDPTSYAAYLTCLEIETPVALSVNHESRCLALARYRPWKMFNYQQKVRNIMWYPKIDVVDFLHKSRYTHNLRNLPTPLPIFEKQFPAEVVEVKRLAIPSTFWQLGFHQDVKVLWPIIDFIDLRELVVVLNQDHERTYVGPLHPLFLSRSSPRTMLPWTLPDDLISDVDMIRGHYEKYGPEYMPLRQRPVVRVVDDEAEIIRTQDLHVVLRCSPCPYLQS